MVISNQPPVESSKIEDSGVLGEDEYSSDSPTDSPKKSKGQKLVKGKVIKNIKDSKDEKSVEPKLPSTPKVKMSSKSCQVIPVKIKSNTTSCQTKPIKEDLKAKASKSKSSSSQTRPAKTVTKGNQTKPKVSRCVNHSVTGFQTFEVISKSIFILRNLTETLFSPDNVDIRKN